MTKRLAWWIDSFSIRFLGSSLTNSVVFFFLVSQAVVSCLVFLFCGGGCFFSLSFSLPILIPSPRGKKWSGLKWETRARSNELLLQSEEPVGWRPPDQMEVPSLSEWTSERAGVFVLPASGATQDQTAQTRTRAHPWNSLPARAGRQQTGKRIVKKKKSARIGNNRLDSFLEFHKRWCVGKLCRSPPKYVCPSVEWATRSKMKRARHTEPCFSWLNPGQIVIHRAAFGPLQPAVVGILSNGGDRTYWLILVCRRRCPPLGFSCVAGGRGGNGHNIVLASSGRHSSTHFWCAR